MPREMPLVLPLPVRTALDAETFARHAHGGQFDKSGTPYIEHLSRVYVQAWTLTDSCDQPELEERVRQVAWLHDVIEDTEYTQAHLLREGFSDKVVQDVVSLTRPLVPVTAYTDWIVYVIDTSSTAALIVKYADVRDNSDSRRLARLEAKTRARLLDKYGPAEIMLHQALVDRGVVRTGGSEGSASITDWATQSPSGDLPAVRPHELCTIMRRRAGHAAPKSGCVVAGCRNGGMLGCPYERQGSR